MTECKHLKECTQRIYPPDCGLCAGRLSRWNHDLCFKEKRLDHPKDKDAMQYIEWKRRLK